MYMYTLMYITYAGVCIYITAHTWPQNQTLLPREAVAGK